MASFIRGINLYILFYFVTVMGHVFKTSFSGKRVKDDNSFAQSVYKMAELAEKDRVKPWERKHAKAALMLSEG